MGCTSSSPSFVDSLSSSIQHRNATEDMELEQQMTASEESNETVVNNNLKDQKNSEKSAPVLPESDNVVETLDIGRNVKIDVVHDESSDVIKNVSETKIDENTVIEVLLTEKKEAEERRRREMDFLEEFAKLTKGDVSEANETVTTNHNKENETATTDLLVDKDGDNAADDKEDVNSVNSPTTRWEALADVAAELPPSLAVDPLTGQIYALK